MAGARSSFARVRAKQRSWMVDKQRITTKASAVMFFRKLFLATLLVSLGSPLWAQDCHIEARASTPTERFKVHTDGTITDTKARLTWMRCSIGMHWKDGNCADVAVQYEWKDAGRFITRLNDGEGYAGYKDWRLPTLKELEEIVEHRCINPAINLEVFPATLPSGYWSSTPDKDYKKGVWLVFFLHGKSYMGNVQQAWKLRLVRDAQ